MIQRYDINHDGTLSLDQAPDGEFVRYADIEPHEKKRLRLYRALCAIRRVIRDTPLLSPGTDVRVLLDQIVSFANDATDEPTGEQK